MSFLPRIQTYLRLHRCIKQQKPGLVKLFPMKITITPKRILAGGLDFLLIKFIEQLLHNLLYIKDGVMVFIIYAALLSIWKTTPAGILLGLKTVSLNDKELSYKKAYFKAFVIMVILIIYTIYTAHLGFDLAASLKAGSVIFFINILPAFFTKRKLMLHDIISRTHVRLEEENRFSKKDKNLLWLILIFAVFFIMFLYIRDIKETARCQNLYTQKQYQIMVNQCANFANDSKNRDLNILVGMSNLKLKNYDAAINQFKAANILQYKVAPYFIAASYMLKGEPNNALLWSERNANDLANDPMMMFLNAGIYLIKFLDSSDSGDLIKATAYSEASVLKFQNNDKNILPEFLTSEQIDKTRKNIKSLANELLSREQLAEVDETVKKLQQIGKSKEAKGPDGSG